MTEKVLTLTQEKLEKAITKVVKSILKETLSAVVVKEVKKAIKESCKCDKGVKKTPKKNTICCDGHKEVKE